MTSDISIGMKAPLIVLPRKVDEGLVQVHLSDFIGRKKIVLLFFPFIYTSVCTDEMCTVSQSLNTYDSLNAEVFAISVDNPFAQEAWAKQHHIKVPILSDFNKTAANAYGVLYPDLLGLKGVAKRSAFVINLKGCISYTFVSENPKKLPDFQIIQEVLK